MSLSKVSLVRYEEPYRSVKKAILDCNGFQDLPANARVFIKPNVVYWTKACEFPKWGVITTSRVIEDVVLLLKERGIADITIGEGMVGDPEDTETPEHAFKSLGYHALHQRYGVKYINVMKRPFKKVKLDGGITLNFNADILESDFLINIPVLKAHNQTVVSLGLKNLKGAIDNPSRKKCHNANPDQDLHYHIARLADPMPPMLTIIDGIYSLERGPGFDGKMRRSNLLIASRDILAADKVGAKVLGYDPEMVPHLNKAQAKVRRPTDLSDLEVVGENIDQVSSDHEYDFPYVSDNNGEMPRALAKQGLKGIFYRKFDDTMCSYCSSLNGVILTAIRQAWQGKPWNNIEILTGKVMKPSPGMEATVLVGQCMYAKNKDHPDIQQLFAAKGCPPEPQGIVDALNGAGISVDHSLFQHIETLPGFYMERYRDNPDFDEEFFQIK